MKSLRLHIPGGALRAFGILSLLFFVLTAAQSVNAKNWSVYTSASFNNGTYIYDQNTSNYYLNTGIRYQTVTWTVSVALPFIVQNSSVYNQGTVSGSAGNTAMQGSESYVGGMGDVYLYSEYRILRNSYTLPFISITGQLKIPTVKKLTLFSSGVFDFGLGLALRKPFGRYNVFADGGYLLLGDPSGINYSNPFSFGFGIGRFFKNGLYSVSVYYKGYTQIIEGIDPPQQISLGLFSHLTDSTIVSLFFGKGFSESSPDYALTGGIEWTL